MPAMLVGERDRPVSRTKADSLCRKGRPKEHDMIVVTGTIELENAEELERVKGALIRRAEKSRADEGNVDYVFSLNLENPLQIRLVEYWQSEGLLNAHLMVPDEEFNAVIASAKIKSAVVDLHEVAESRELLRR